jgi:hypothetical protein
MRSMVERAALPPPTSLREATSPTGEEDARHLSQQYLTCSMYVLWNVYRR